MKLLLATTSAILLTSAAALAQPATQPPPPPPPGGGGGMPATGPDYQPAAAPAPAPVPATAATTRVGFTAMLSIGYGLTTISPDQGDGDTESGLAGLNLDLGTYLSPELAVFFTIGGTNFTLESGFGDLDFINGFVGVVSQYWIDPNLALGGGVGLGYFALINEDADIDPETGLAIMARANYRFAGGWQGMLSIAPSFYDGATVTSTSFLIAYQWD